MAVFKKEYEFDYVEFARIKLEGVLVGEGRPWQIPWQVSVTELGDKHAK